MLTPLTVGTGLVGWVGLPWRRVSGVESSGDPKPGRSSRDEWHKRVGGAKKRGTS